MVERIRTRVRGTVKLLIVNFLEGWVEMRQHLHRVG